MIKRDRGGNVVSDAPIASPELRFSTILTTSFPVTVKDEEETKKDDGSQRGADNSCCPSSIGLAIGIGAVLTNNGAITTTGGYRGAGRIALVLLVEWVSRIEGMRACNLAGTGSTVAITRCREQFGGAILTLAVP